TTITVGTGSTTPFTAANFPFSDPSDSPANGFLAVKIGSTVPTGLTYQGASAANQTIPVANLSQLRFVAPGTQQDLTFSFQVQDNGGTANNGADTSTAATLTLHVVPGGGGGTHAPSGANNTVNTIENTAYIVQTADIGFSDTSDTPP